MSTLIALAGSRSLRDGATEIVGATAIRAALLELLGRHVELNEHPGGGDRYMGTTSALERIRTRVLQGALRVL